METNERIGNKAPDWGINYGVKELWSEIVPGLWVGGTHDNDTVDVPRNRVISRQFDVEDAEIGPSDFDAVVTLYAWARPVDWHVEELRTGVMDSPRPTADEIEMVVEAAAWAKRRLDRGKKVLIRCQAGLNRSSLVAALVLMDTGLSAAEAITLIRAKRSPEALFNTGFVRLLSQLER